MHLTGGVIVLLALGLGLTEAVRAYLRRSRIYTSVMGRVRSARVGHRIDRVGEAQTMASAAAAVTFDARSEPVGSAAAREIAEAVQAFGGGEDAPALLRVTGHGDLAALVRTSRSGDLWLRLNDFDQWPDRGERRETLIDAIARHPEWDDEAVYEAAIALALWENDGGFGMSRARNRKRVHRLRAAASRDLVYLDDVRAERDAAAQTNHDRVDHTAA